jgi:hypothetical protein
MAQRPLVSKNQMARSFLFCRRQRPARDVISREAGVWEGVLADETDTAEAALSSLFVTDWELPQAWIPIERARMVDRHMLRFMVPPKIMIQVYTGKGAL